MKKPLTKPRAVRHSKASQGKRIRDKNASGLKGAKSAKGANLVIRKPPGQTSAKTFQGLSLLAVLTDDGIRNIIFNETRSLSGAKIATARENIAHAIINGEEHPPRPTMAPPTVDDVPTAEQPVYDACLTAVSAARAARKKGQDPTQGGKNFNFRKDNSTGPFQGHVLQTQVGPLDNSYPTDDLPASGIYANTYK